METTAAAADAERSRAFAREVKALVSEHFARTGASRHANRDMILKSLAMAVLYFGAYGLLLTGSLAWPLAWLGCVAMGVGLAGLGFTVAHDALHGAYSSHPRVNRALGLAFEALGGDGYAWTLTHNGAHHGLPNVKGHDEDVDVTALVRLSPHSPYRPIHRYQHLFAFGLYALSTLNWALVKDYAYYLRRDPKGSGPGRAAWARLLAGKFAFYAAMALPFVVLPIPAWQVVIGLLTVHMTAGLIVGVVFQLAHVVEGAEHLGPSGAAVARDAWAAHQLRATSNFAPGARLLGWYVGGLNYQVEHHLFPRVCHVHYPALSRIVEPAARRHGLPYNSIPTLRQAIGAHYRTLRVLGRAPAVAAPVASALAAEA